MIYMPETLCFLVSADKSKKARPCCSCAASDGQTDATERQHVPTGEVINQENTDLFDSK